MLVNCWYETDLAKYSGYAFSSMGLSDHGTLEISLPWWSYFSYTIDLFSIIYLCEVFLLSICGSVKEPTVSLFWDIRCVVVLKILSNWYIGSFIKMPPIIYIGRSGVNFRKKWFVIIAFHYSCTTRFLCIRHFIRYNFCHLCNKSALQK